LSDLITEDEYKRLLRNRVRELGGPKKVAKLWSIQQEFLEAVLSGEEPPGISPTCYQQMGYVPVVMFKKVRP
jgi:hypothetical protein